MSLSLGLLLGCSSLHASTANTEPLDVSTLAQQRLTPLSKDLESLQTVLGQQFSSNRVLGSWFWGVLLQAAPANSYLRESLVAVRLVMSSTKEFGTQDVLETMLSSRLTQYGLQSNFVAQQKDWLTRLWAAYNAPTSDALWALPFVTQQLEIIAQQPNTPQAIAQAIETLTTVVPAVQAMAVAGEAILDSVQKVGGSCC